MTRRRGQSKTGGRSKGAARGRAEGEAGGRREGATRSQREGAARRREQGEAGRGIVAVELDQVKPRRRRFSEIPQPLPEWSVRGTGAPAPARIGGAKGERAGTAGAGSRGQEAKRRGKEEIHHRRSADVLGRQYAPTATASPFAPSGRF